MRSFAFVAAVAIAVGAIASCSRPPDPAALESLADGYWHGALGPYDLIYDFRLAGERLSGFSHQLVDGHQRAAMAMTDVSFDGTTVEMSFPGMAPYRGEVDLEADRIVGGHPGAGAFADLNLTRVAPEDWPMVAAMSSSASGDSSYTWTQPSDLGDGWQPATPEEAGIDPAAIDATVEAVIRGDAGWMHSLLIVRHGKLVVDEYFYGWQPDDVHRIASCTKSVDSLLVGIAIDRGEIPGVDVPLLDYFPERRANAGEGWDALRLEHLLTMSMGLDWTDVEAETFPPADQDRFTDVISRNVSTEPGTRFRYVSRNVDLLSMVLLRATGSHADAFAAERLFAPLGIDTWDWDNNRYEGHPAMSGTLMMRPRDMAKLGQLLLQEGAWDGRQVVSADWIRESTAVRFNPTAGDEYGYLWWGFDDPPPGVDFASGNGSQFIVAAPALDLVVVTTGANEYNDKHAAILDLIKQHLGPGLR